MGSPITSWEGVSAFFTYADRPGVMYVLLALSVIVTVGAIIIGANHEKAAYKEAYRKVNGG
jgi:hypothetical protein